VPNEIQDALPDETETIEANTEAPPQAAARRTGTFDSFRHRDFTLFWTGSLISNTGTWMQTAALAIVVWGLRGREFDLGLVNFAAGIPVLFLALPAGVMADRFDKRRLLIWFQALLALQAAALWGLSLAGRLSPDHAVEALLWIAGLGLVGGVLSALTFPTWQSFLPDLVSREGLMNGIALNSAQFQVSRLLGPLLASGLMLLGISTGDIFLVNAASYLFVIAALWAISPHPQSAAAGTEHARREPEGPWATLTAGVRYATQHRVVGVLIVSTAFMTVFAMPYMMLLPAIAEKALGGGRIQYSWLLAANGFGAIFGSLGVASMPVTARRERLIPLSILVMSFLLAAFSMSRSFALSMVLSALAGAAFLTTNSLTNTSIQATVPGALRGRVMALFVMSFMGIMPISSAIFGPLGEWIGPTNAVSTGAVFLFAWAVFLLLTGLLAKQDVAGS
jgi:MFS family permease